MSYSKLLEVSPLKSITNLQMDQELEYTVIDKAIVAEAVDNGKLIAFNSWGNQVQLPASELLYKSENYELGLLTIMAYDVVFEKWFMYKDKGVEMLWNREIADHFAENRFRLHHQKY